MNKSFTVNPHISGYKKKGYNTFSYAFVGRFNLAFEPDLRWLALTCPK